MPDYLAQSSTGEVIVFLQDPDTGLGKAGLTSSDVSVSLKKTGDAVFSVKSVVDAASASASVGSLPDSQVTVTYDTPGTGGNTFTLSVEDVNTPGTPQPSPSISLVGSDITINLAHDGAIPLNTVVNNATNLASLTLAGFTLSASGTGAGILSAAEGPTAFTGGVDSTFTDMGSGFYSITLSSSDTNTLGKLYVRVTSALAKPALVDALVIASFDVAESTATVTDTPETTVVFGTVFDLSGVPLANASVTAIPTSQPTIVNGAIVYSNLVSTKTDANGFFALTLIEGVQVEIFIPAVNYRRSFTVPAESTNLFCIA